MWNSKRTILIVMVSWMVVVPVCLASADTVVSGRELLQAVRQRDSRRERPVRRDRGAYRTAKTGRGRGDRDHPSAIELLDKYTESLDKLKSVIIKSTSSGLRSNAPASGHDEQELRLDGTSKYLRTVGWGYMGQRTGIRSKDKPVCVCTSYDGKSFIRISGRPVSRVRIELVDSAAGGDEAIDMISRGYSGSNLLGYFRGDDERVDSIMRRSGRISLRERLERVRSSECFVLDAVTKRGRYTLWIDPEHGYNLARAKTFKGTGDMFGDDRIEQGSFYASVEVTRFKKIEDVWIPWEADLEFGQDGEVRLKYKGHHKRTMVILNPDHEALQSFCPDEIPSGMKVKAGSWAASLPDKDTDDLVDADEYFIFKWQPEAEYVVNEKCQVVSNDPSKHLLPLVKVLVLGSSMEDFRPEPPAPEAIGRKVLLCFWDMNQQESQQLLFSLRDRQETLAEKGVSVIAVEASGAKTDKVRSWVRKNKLTFPVGTSYALYEGLVRRTDENPPALSQVVTSIPIAYGIERLPWLIFTDDDWAVVGEGLSLKELDERLPDEPINVSSLSEPVEQVKVPSRLLPDQLQEGLVLYYSFDQDQGNKVVDISGNNRHGEVRDARHVQDPERGGAMSFDRTVGPYPIIVRNIDVDAFSFSAWVKKSRVIVNDRGIFLLTDLVNCYSVSGNSRGGVGLGGINVYDRQFEVGRWTHIIGTYDGRTFKIYWDGELAKARDKQAKGITGTLIIGSGAIHDGKSWLGRMDEVAVFDLALTKEEVKLLYKNTKHNR